MKTIAKILLGFLSLIVIVMVVLLSYVKFGLPKVGDPPDLQVEITPERLERGAYLTWYSPNITPSGLGDWTEEAFLMRFKI